MGEPIKVPAPIYEQAVQEANEKDTTRGAIIAEWKRKADAYDSVLFSEDNLTGSDDR
jgi:hypothetical protein